MTAGASALPTPAEAEALVREHVRQLVRRAGARIEGQGRQALAHLRQRAAHVLGDADWWMLVLAAPVYVASLGILCYRWHLLVHMAQGWSNLPRAAEAFLTSVVINYAAPIGLAVPSRAALTRRALGLDSSSRSTWTTPSWSTRACTRGRPR